MLQNASRAHVALSRRGALLGLTAAFSLGRASLALAAAPTQNRFVVFLLRGAMDGLSAVQPYGDANCVNLRGSLALAAPGSDGGLLDLGGFYGMHPELKTVHAMYTQGDALVLHAVAGAYRSRSHFEAQDYMECGVEQRIGSGWLNRAVAQMQAPRGEDIALSMGVSAPLILRGPAQVAAWAPEHFGQAPPDEFYGRLLALSAHDPVIGPALQAGYKQRGMSPGNLVDDKQAVLMLAAAAGRLLAAPTGPRVAVLEMGGWDTHNAQAPRLRQNFKQFDSALAALQTNLGPAWKSTVVLVVTEFGRTARINGTNGTDHGTAGVSFLLGGAVAGGHVRADWPGLGSGRLFEDRDLQPTLDVREVAKGVLAGHLGLDGAGLAAAFPGSEAAPPLRGLLRV